MKINIQLKEGGLIELPENMPFLAAFIGQEGMELHIHGNFDSLFIALCKLICVLFARRNPMEIASALGTIRNSLVYRKVMPDNVDMAVSFEGHVLPLDETLAEHIAEQKEKHDAPV